MSNSDSPLHLAVRNNNIEIVKMLLESQCDIHAVNAEGQTPLQLATQTGNTEMVALLLQHGAGRQADPAPPSRPNTPHPQTTTPSAPSAPLSPLEQRKQKITYWTKLYSIAYAVHMLGQAIIGMARIVTLQHGAENFDSISFDDLLSAMEGWAMMSIVLAIPTGIFLGVTFYCFVVRIWEEVPREFARTTPERAAGFSFIPLFNLYWWFQCFLGLFQDMNKVTEHYGQGTRFSTPLIKGVCIYWVAATIITTFLGDSRYDLHILFTFVSMGMTIPTLWYIRQQVLKFIDIKTKSGI